MSNLKSFLQSNKFQIFLTSFLVLFLELALIRWLNANIMSLAYFSNLVLLASFFGIGLGCITSKKYNSIRLLPIALVAISIISIIPVSFSTSFENVMMFQHLVSGYLKTPFWLIATTVFVMVSVTFVTLGQKLGRCFVNMNPIDAYIWDLAGSIIGIISFTTISFFNGSVTLWIIIIISIWVILMLLETETKNSLLKNIYLNIALITITLLFVSAQSQNRYWSPYYSITIREETSDFARKQGKTEYVLSVNQTSHQSLHLPGTRMWIYESPYKIFKNPNYNKILIIGAGTGSDTAVALSKNVKEVDAIEIDPTIAELGTKFHPSKPYDDKRVKVQINDGRNFLENNKKEKYDLIIFALTDSITLASSYANTRLESYLFTLESFKKAKENLSENGMVVLYNYYREPWLVEKLAKMLSEVFESESYVVSADGKLASIFAGKKLSDLDETQIKKFGSEFSGKYYSAKNYDKNLFAKDNWPFLYLKEPGFPKIYLITSVLIISLIILSLVILSPRESENSKKPWSMLFLGIGFMLLETKNVINFQLLFGSTWLVNSLVFVAILSMALIASIMVKNKVNIKKSHLYLVMVLALILNYSATLSIFTTLSDTPKYLAASFVSFLPIFIANLIFAKFFNNIQNSHIAFGFNLIGAMIGGLLEYSSMVFGYNNLSFLILASYILAFACAEKNTRS